ncbi:uncharacterized protein LOC119731981 [Patiria miniata]|uniref:RING-type E3 ubiquitin transferase n=1 Tax=Patiria miniata TaxID=46514 RepID=A0A914ACQ9_PATMI|nr:uncharacterized protein LOC119731981 [Patiria miniata]
MLHRWGEENSGKEHVKLLAEKLQAIQRYDLVQELEKVTGFQLHDKDIDEQEKPTSDPQTTSNNEEQTTIAIVKTEPSGTLVGEQESQIKSPHIVMNFNVTNCQIVGGDMKDCSINYGYEFSVKLIGMKEGQKDEGRTHRLLDLLKAEPQVTTLKTVLDEFNLEAIGLQKGCVQLTVRVESREDLDRFWEACKKGLFQTRIKSELPISEVKISEDVYKEGCQFFDDAKKQNIQDYGQSGGDGADKHDETRQMDKVPESGGQETEERREKEDSGHGDASLDETQQTTHGNMKHETGKISSESDGKLKKQAAEATGGDTEKIKMEFQGREGDVPEKEVKRTRGDIGNESDNGVIEKGATGAESTKKTEEDNKENTHDGQGKQINGEEGYADQGKASPEDQGPAINVSGNGQDIEKESMKKDIGLESDDREKQKTLNTEAGLDYGVQVNEREIGQEDIDRECDRKETLAEQIGAKEDLDQGKTAMEGGGLDLDEGRATEDWSCIGMRVVRGPDWEWDDQDGGCGCVGTVVPAREVESNSTVWVRWDSGVLGEYRAGGESGKVDLQIYDNAQQGVKHSHVICDGCDKSGLEGIRWKCLRCDDCDLCHNCYNECKHDLEHPFLRIDEPGVAGVRVPRRYGAVQCMAFGIFPGARVVRGPDWASDIQDGKAGTVGVVSSVSSSKTTYRSFVRVQWSAENCNIYRRGFFGKMDLQYTEKASNGQFFMEHLPMLEKYVRGGALLFEAAANGDIGKVREILSIYPSAVIYRNERGITALHAASHLGHLDVVIALVDGKASLEQQDEDGDTALSYAVMGNHQDVVLYLLLIGSNPNTADESGVTPLHRAASKGHDNCARFLLKSGLRPCNVNSQDILGDTPLFAAIVEKHDFMVDLLIEHMTDDDLRLQNNDGLICLHLAALFGNDFAAEKILRVSPSMINIAKSDGFTALHIAAINGCAKVMETLFQQEDCNIGARTAEGQTALDIAVEESHYDCITLFMLQGAVTSKGAFSRIPHIRLFTGIHL